MAPFIGFWPIIQRFNRTLFNNEFVGTKNCRPLDVQFKLKSKFDGTCIGLKSQIVECCHGRNAFTNHFNQRPINFFGRPLEKCVKLQWKLESFCVIYFRRQILIVFCLAGHIQLIWIGKKLELTVFNELKLHCGDVGLWFEALFQFLVPLFGWEAGTTVETSPAATIDNQFWGITSMPSVPLLHKFQRRYSPRFRKLLLNSSFWWCYVQFRCAECMMKMFFRMWETWLFISMLECWNFKFMAGEEREKMLMEKSISRISSPFSSTYFNHSQHIQRNNDDFINFHQLFSSFLCLFCFPI